MKLREYQREAVAGVREKWKTNASAILILPTGCGKTICFGHLIKQIFPKRVLVLANRRELIQQAFDKVSKITGFRCDIEMSDQKVDLHGLYGKPQVIISSVQTQCSGGDGSGRMSKFDPMMFGAMVIDEAHSSCSAQYRRLVAYYRRNPNLKILGVTATPDRSDGKSLGQIFETVAYDYEILSAIHDGWLVPVKQQVVTLGSLDISQVKTTGGDLNGPQLAKVMEGEENLQGVASSTLDIAGNKRTLVFTASVDQAERLSDIFNRHKQGISQWVCGKTPTETRKRMLKDFYDGVTQIICNCSILCEGYDNPSVEVCVMAKPTKSRSRYAQMIGRSLRPLECIAHELNDCASAEDRRAMIAASAKTHALILDFVGNAGRHKLMSTADILGGKVSDEAIEAAKARAKSEGKPVDMSAMLEEEEELKRQAEAKRIKLIARAKYAMRNVDPFDVLQLEMQPDNGWNQNRVLSDKQRGTLERQGIDPDTLTYTQGQQLISEIFRRYKAGLCSYKQSRFLRKRGMDGNVSKAEASRIFETIKMREGWKQ